MKGVIRLKANGTELDVALNLKRFVTGGRRSMRQPFVLVTATTLVLVVSLGGCASAKTHSLVVDDRAVQSTTLASVVSRHSVVSCHDYWSSIPVVCSNCRSAALLTSNFPSIF